MKEENVLMKLRTVSVDHEKGGTTGTLKGLGYAVGLNDCEEESSLLLAVFSISFFMTCYGIRQ